MSFRTFFSFLAFLAIFVGLTGCNSQMTIINDIDEQQANEILVYLSSKGIVAEKIQSTTGSESAAGGPVVVMWNIAVEPSQATEAMSLLNRSGLPRPTAQNLLDIFGQPGLVPTDLEEQIRYRAGLSQQIASTIRKIDGILDADVIIAFPAPESTDPITASVLIKHQGIVDNPNSHLKTKIQQLVSSSVSGLKIENVTVLPDRSRYMDVSLSGLTIGDDEEKEVVSVWGIIVAKDSTTRLRTIFFTFIIVIIVLLLALGWLIWKMWPTLSEGGWKNIFSKNPLISSNSSKSEETTFSETPKEQQNTEENDEDENP